MAVRAIGSAARMMLMFGPYLRHVGDDPLAWYSDPEHPDLSWSESHDVLLLRFSPPSADPRKRWEAFRRLLGTTAIGHLELLVLRQAAEDLAAYDESDDEGAFHPLADLVADYLSSVDSVVHGPALSRSALRAVLDELKAPSRRSPGSASASSTWPPGTAGDGRPRRARTHRSRAAAAPEGRRPLLLGAVRLWRQLGALLRRRYRWSRRRS
ncbi:hypothetical protein ACFQXA_08420 [Nocardiopsis composta]